MFEKFKDAIAWKFDHTKGMHDYYENTRNGDRKVILQTERVINGFLIAGFAPYDSNWLSEAKGKAIIQRSPIDKEVIEHQDLHRLKSSLTLPRGGSAFAAPKPGQ